MKRRVLLPEYGRGLVFLSIFMLAIAAGVLYLYIGTDDFRIILSANGGIAVWVVECMCLAVVALCIHEMVHGLSGAKYSVDENGMTTYLGKRVGIWTGRIVSIMA